MGRAYPSHGTSARKLSMVMSKTFSGTRAGAALLALGGVVAALVAGSPALLAGERTVLAALAGVADAVARRSSETRRQPESIRSKAQRAIGKAGERSVKPVTFTTRAVRSLRRLIGMSYRLLVALVLNSRVGSFLTFFREVRMAQFARILCMAGVVALATTAARVRAARTARTTRAA